MVLVLPLMGRDRRASKVKSQAESSILICITFVMTLDITHVPPPSFLAMSRASVCLKPVTNRYGARGLNLRREKMQVTDPAVA
jgi:hypothetical protein